MIYNIFLILLCMMSTIFYGSDEIGENHLKNKVFFFIGYPGSGKGTQGKKISQLLHMNHLSTGELFRAEAKKGTPLGLEMDAYMKRGEIIPKELTFQYLRQELSDPKYCNGLILDGYPKNIECFHFIMSMLDELQFEPAIAFHFKISREDVLDRLTSRLHCERCEKDYHKKFLKPQVEWICDLCGDLLESRPDDSAATINKRLDVFEKNTNPVIHQLREKGILLSLDAMKNPEALSQDILDILFQHIRSQGSYFLRQPAEGEKSSVFHNHIDAKTHPLLQEIVKKIEAESVEFQNKIYPVGYLALGPQMLDPRFASTYQALPNFHPIHHAANEAFSTGKMGNDGFNYSQVLTTLQAASQYPNCGIMTEIEEDIFGQSFDEKGNAIVTLDRGNTPYAVDWARLPGWKEKLIENLPRFELHHGFDIVKFSGEKVPPIDVELLSAAASLEGFNTGGWFIFNKGTHWAYRSNEFSNDEYIDCIETLKIQAYRLRSIVANFLLERPFTSSCSLEKVHAIWPL